jgi:hypothetical protein
MLNPKELLYIVLSAVTLALIISMLESVNIFLYALLAIFVVIVINVLAKKITAYYLDSDVEVKLWEVQRYGYKSHQQFQNPIQAGLFVPIILGILSFGYLQWLASLTFEVQPKVYRAAKRHGLYTFSEMTEYHLGIIAAAGVLANLLFAIIFYLVGLEGFARLNIYFAFFSMIPLSNLDGNKIYFGNVVIWSFLAALVLAGLFFAFFVV